jgi:hypothetical protein
MEDQMSVKVLAVDELAAMNMAEFSQIVAIRWDLVERGLVLDINCSELSDGDGDSRRGWLVFEGISEISWSLENSRLPNGVVITSPLGKSHIKDGFIQYEIRHLAPSFNDDDQIVGPPNITLMITCMRLTGFVSSSAIPAQDTWLNYTERNSLATECDFISAVEESRRNLVAVGAGPRLAGRQR